MTLAAAQRALDAGDDAATLVALVEAWRANKHPRMADLIDRVLARIGGTVEGKTVKARTAAWTELAKQRRTVDIGRLFSAPWPGTWKPCLPLVELACDLPPDPRTAIALAKLVGDERFDTYTASRFYSRIINHVRSLGDVRVLPILEAVVDKPMSHYYRDTKKSVVAAIESLATLTPSLDATDEAAVTALEGRFAEAIIAERTSARGRAEFLATIYANPDDDAARSVFADWLTEEGDPLGEFIALQLANADRKRQQTLINKHGKLWAGALDSLIDKDGRVFEHGFLASAQINVDVDDGLPEGFHDPAWATLHTVSFGWNARRGRSIVSILSLPSFANVRHLLGVQDVDLLACAPRPQLESVDLRLTRDAPADRARILDGVAFPKLRQLGFTRNYYDEDIVATATAFVAGSPQSQRLERITLRGDYPQLAKAIDLADRLQLAEAAVAEMWLLVMRDGVLRAEPETGWTLPWARGLAEALDVLAPAQLTALHVPALPYEYSAQDLELLAKSLARFPHAKIDVPWPHITSTPAEPLCVVINFDRVDLQALWPLVTAPPISLSCDAMSINYGGKHMPVDGDVLPRAVAAFAKKRTDTVEVYNTMLRAAAHLSVRRGYIVLTSAFSDEPGFVDAYLAWLERCAAIGGMLGYVLFDQRPPDSEALGAVNWIILAKEQWKPDEVEAAARTVPWVRTHRIGNRVALVLGPRPSAVPTAAQVEELDRAFAPLNR